MFSPVQGIWAPAKTLAPFLYPLSTISVSIEMPSLVPSPEKDRHVIRTSCPAASEAIFSTRKIYLPSPDRGRIRPEFDMELFFADEGGGGLHTGEKRPPFPPLPTDLISSDDLVLVSACDV